MATRHEPDTSYLDYIDNSKLSQSYAGIQSFERTRASYSGYNTFIEIEPSRSVRPPYGKNDYNAFRYNEGVPNKQKQVIKMCMEAYDNVGIIRNVIDLMSDFASQGITIVHANKTIERFYRKWWDKINGVQKTERFLNYLYRTGNPIVRRTTAKITPKKIKEMKSSAKIKNLEEQKLAKKEIPWGYEFLNPLVMDYIKKDGEYTLVMNITNKTQREMLNSQIGMTEEIRKLLDSGSLQIPMSPEEVRVFHYKKDDWLLWANPMIRPILDDINMLEKMKLADLAALDGAISNVRLWTVGDLEYKIMPKKPIIDKLRDILASNVGGGTMDLIWGPDLKFQESASQVYKFLGSEKYGPVYTSIYGGLGIPLSLTGAGGASGYTNNAVSLKALIERLEYGREVLLSFWRYEFKLLADAMDFASPAKIHFDSVVLADESSVKSLIIDLWDRNIISDETVLERFKENPEIEKARKAKEHKDEMAPDTPKTAGPYHSGDHKEEMVKLAMDNQVLDVKDYMDKLGIKSQKPPVVPVAGGAGKPKSKPKKSASPSGGRPVNTPDTVKRKTKKVLPRTKGFNSDVYMWAVNAQNIISDALIPFALHTYAKKNVRSLSKIEFDTLEELKLSVLVSIKPFSEVNNKTIKAAIDSNQKPSQVFLEEVQSNIKSFVRKCQKAPSVEELRTIYAITFAQLN